MTEELLIEEEQASMDELIAICDQRAKTYGLLARIYAKEVDAELLEELHAGRFPVSTGTPEADKGYRMIATYLSGRWGGTLTELAVDYTRTFFGNAADAFSAAYPLESVYTSEKRLRMQEARDEVLAIYRSQKLDKNETWIESEDHLSVELEFMQVMSIRAAEALAEGNEDLAVELFDTSKNFLEDHLTSWVPMLASDMKRFSKTDFYKGVAFLTDGFLETDFEFLSDLLAEDEEAEEMPAIDSAEEE